MIVVLLLEIDVNALLVEMQKNLKIEFTNNFVSLEAIKP